MMRFRNNIRVPSLERTDYVQEIAEHNRCLKIHEINERKGMPENVEVGSNTRTVTEIHRIQNSIRYKISGAINLACLLILI